MALDLLVLAAVLAGGLYASRRLQHGYIDYLSPLLVLYALHGLGRAAMVHYLPGWLDVNEQMAAASETAIAEAVRLLTLSVVALVAGYLLATRIGRAPDATPGTIMPLSLDVAVALVVAGLACRALLRLNAEGIVTLPDWAATPVDTLGWAAIAGVFSAAFDCARRPHGARAGAAGFTIAAVAAILAVDAQLSVSREATLKPVLAALLGFAMGSQMPVWRVCVWCAAIGLPVFVWIGALKTHVNLDLGRQAGYVTAVAQVREHSGLGWPQWIVGMTQDRFHGIDSLVITRSLVPSVIPFEPGSVWRTAFVSAFVPRALYPEKQVGWGARFASDFWGVSPEAAGRVAVGITHLGTFYMYGGAWSCVTGMALLGAGLGLLAAWLRRQQTMTATTLFVLTALTICQVDRDLEVVLGGVLKQLVIFGVVLGLLPLHPTTIHVPRLAGRVVRHRLGGRLS